MSNDTTIPAPFLFAPSEAWDGADGSWSTFIIRIGTPEQNFRVLPSTMSNEVLVPVPEGCLSSDPDNCGNLRGVYPFNNGYSSGFQYNQSSSWRLIGLYDLALEQELNYTGNGLYGFDTVGLQIQNSGGLSLTNQAVAGIATKDFLLGLFGLSPKPSNFSNFEYPQPSFMRTLWDQKKIPSLSYAYTAGASYRIPKLPGSLILGGYDTARFTQSSNSPTFPFDADDSRVLSIGIQSITSTNTLRGTVNLLSSPILSIIDSTVPQIWLPKVICDEFESTFGLTYDPRTDLYLVNETMHSQLLKINPSITFRLGNDANPANTININLPYAAFDLRASWPIYTNSTPYFPLRRAENNTQYRLGRTFLQEAYVVADYERSNFSIFQARFQSPMPAQNIVTIFSPTLLKNGTHTNGTSNHNILTSAKAKLSTGSIVGIAIGIIGLILLLSGLFLYLYRQRKRSLQNQDSAPGEPPGSLAPHASHSEMPDQNHYEMFSFPPEILGSKVPYELQAKDHHLLSDDHLQVVHELPVPEKELSARQRQELDGVGVERETSAGEGEKHVILRDGREVAMERILG